ncbi:unnamed protein product [Kuraishia capsulata CBS 1993]|uniref:tRNA (guanine(26)-N(2))-dimethyltransferase n=1 Tax=Kuraishia capsulata CBS 1993 TaxID=1382522 RepID=W6MF82_9ASCO|nr:uncharacterized protein KUCA_T00000066001 [Kuraishia capsulata CBS 1993]CDK24106.1 unnamed protein product [Kuraishia capsulata CBS 1993]
MLSRIGKFLPRISSIRRMSTIPEGFEEKTEGSATILYPSEDVDVFYNPIQQFNRDLSVLAIRAWINIQNERRLAKLENQPKKRKISSTSAEPTRFVNIAEALSATGLRSIRYAKEIPQVKKIVANDLSAPAVKSIQGNIEHNKVGDLVIANQGDAIHFMSSPESQSKFQVVDLDPYGTAAPFIDSAIQCMTDDGLLLVTCTDLAVLAGNSYPEKCFVLYGGTNTRGDAVHESALRLVLNLVASTAAKYGKCIEPLLSLSIDYYVRCFIRVKRSPIQLKQLASQSMITYLCSGCGSTANQYMGRKTEDSKGQGGYKFSMSQGPPVGPHCSFCGNVHHLTGPMWGGNLHNHEFIDKVLELKSSVSEGQYGTLKRVEGMLHMAKQEVDAPFYFKPTTISSVLKAAPPSVLDIITGLKNLGYESSLTHAMPSGIKTEAPWETIWYVCKKLGEKDEGFSQRLEKTSQTAPGYKIWKNENIGKDIESQEDLFKHNETTKAIKTLRKIKIVRFQENPTKNWGPQSRPGKK